MVLSYALLIRIELYPQNSLLTGVIVFWVDLKL